jgi:peptide/nickel transport system permease protein
MSVLPQLSVDAAADLLAGSPRRSGHALSAARLLRRAPLVPLLIWLLLIGVGLAAPLVAPHDPNDQQIVARLHPPFWQVGGSTAHLLGTDSLGRDELSRLIYGTRMALVVVATTVVAGAVLGTVLGLLAGYFGGWTDLVVMRLVDLQLALPALLFGVLLASALHPSLRNVLIIIIGWTWAGFARIVRSEVLGAREQEYIVACRSSGARWPRILFRHITPNVANTVIVLATLNVSVVILFEASLSFLGLGVPPPAATWGSMVSDGQNYISIAWWIVTVPGLAIFFVCLAANLLGDWTRDVLDPRLSHSR